MYNNLFKKENLIMFTVIFGLSLLAILMHGYFFGVSDQEIFIPYILKLNNPSLFGNDLLFTQNSFDASVFYRMIEIVIRLLSLQKTFIIGYFIFQFVFFYALYRLALYLTKNKTVAIASLFLFLVPKFIGGTANFTYDTFFGHRSVGTIFLIFYLIYLFEQKFNKAAAIAAVGIWFHPLSIIPNLLLLPVLIIASGKPSERLNVLLRTLSLFAMLLIPYLLFSKINAASNLNNAFDAKWLEIIKSRDDYLFISTWKITAWAALGLYLAPIALFFQKINKKNQKSLKFITIASFIIFFANTFVLEVIKIPAVAQFQLVRAITPLAYIGLIMAVYFISSKSFWRNVLGFLAFIALSINFFIPFMVLTVLYAITFIIIPSTNQSLPKVSRVYITLTLVLVVLLFVFINKINVKNIGTRIQYSKSGSDWIDVQKWAKANTNQSDIFLVPPAQTGFRIFSQRPIVGDIKDGATVIYSPIYAKQWNDRMIKLTDYASFDKQQFLNLRSELYFNFIVTKNSQILNFETVHRNSSFNVYKIEN